MDGPWDVAIIGAGPSGLAAAIYTGRARRSTVVLEKGLIGGQILVTDWVENYPGFPDGLGPAELMQRLERHAEKFGAKFESDEVTSITGTERDWRLVGAKREHAARAVILAMGSTYRRLCIANEDRLVGHGVSYCATCDGAFYAGKDVIVVGGGDNAMKEALFLTKYCRTVTVVHRRARLRGEKIYQERVLANEKIRILWDTVVEAVDGKDRVESVTLADLKTSQARVLPIDGLFVSIGSEPRTGFVKGFVELNEIGQVKVGANMMSSVPGIFAAGDVSDACPRQIATAVGSGVNAALAVEEYLSRG